MPNNLISRIEGLLEKATKAPWSADDRSFGDENEPPYGPYGYVSTPGRRGKPILQAIQSRKVNDDLRLVVELRNAAPALMKVVRAAQVMINKCPKCGGTGHIRRYGPGCYEQDVDPCSYCSALRTALAQLEERDAK